MTVESHSNPRAEALRLSYAQVCASYHGVTEFRGKLLSLLPLASGTGAYLLLNSNSEHTYFVPVGLFGVVVTLGLFMYELRGIQRCHRLEKQAKALEMALELEWNEAQFLSQPKRGLRNMFGPPGAGLVVYFAVVFVWLYVAGVGGGLWGPKGSAEGSGWILLAAYAVVLPIAWIATSAWLTATTGADVPQP